MFIFHAILMILFALYSSSNSVNKMCQRICWDLDRFKVMGGQKGATPKKSTFLFLIRFWKFFFHWNPHGNPYLGFSNRFLITLKVSELLGAKRGQNRKFKEFVECLFFTLFEWFFFQNVDHFNSFHKYLQQIWVIFYHFNVIDGQIQGSSLKTDFFIVA